MSQTHLILKDWYQKNHRKLSFRENRDPYRIWISEIMAQQTQIDTLLPYYDRWMNQFKSIESITLVDEETLLKAWEGLGYYSRVRNIKKAAHIIQENYHGIFPHTRDEILKLPGIGPYTASAIASICFDEKCAAIDGNVKRVFSRLFKLDSMSKTFESFIHQQIIEWMNEVEPYILTQALMEWGAIICTKQAKCLTCPLQNQCLAYQHQVVDDYPKAKEKMKQKLEYKEVLLLRNKKNQIALTLTHLDSLMKGYYRLPELIQIHQDLTDLKKDKHMSHVFSHKIWEVDFYELEINETQDDLVWINLDELKNLPIITLHRKYLDSKSL